VGAKFLVTQGNGGLKLKLQWSGENPGENKKSLARSSDPSTKNERLALLSLVQEMAKSFRSQHPKEQTVQIGLGSNVHYQDLLTVMDGLKEYLPDFVLISNFEAEAFSKEDQG
jgi:biopolymer transport protein ExbD